MDTLGTWERTVYCGQVGRAEIGSRVTVMGWADRRRDLGNLIFLHLRDREGIIQVVVNPAHPEALEKAKQVRTEFVLAVTGKVVERAADTVNPDLPTGEIEVVAEELRILNEAQTPPFPVNEPTDAAEDTRLRYRFLDLRRPRLQRNLKLRHQIALECRKELDASGFLEIETPFLTRSTPEGARDFLVPSRLHRGHFYALPQSPQLFKQILIVSGFDRYFQIVRCFRDEDLRADRQPEFTQVDIEMAFPHKEHVFGLVERLLARVFQLIGVELPRPFPRLTYGEAMDRFGTDRPDTRFALELVDLSEAFRETSFRVFAAILDGGGVIKGITVPGAAGFSRKQLDDLGDFVKVYGAPALSWIRRSSEGFRSSLPKVVETAQLQRVADTAGLNEGDLCLMVAGKPAMVHAALGALRLQLARERQLLSSDAYHFLWVHEFPLVEWDEEEERYFSLHHPFTSPRDEDVPKLSGSPGEVRAKAYDVVLNGLEIGGGSIRIHQSEVQRKVFEILGIDPQEAEARFGFLLEALRYGAPPHGGIALGLDRIAMLLAGESSIREVMAFPKTARGLDLMCGAPSPVDDRQLRELHIQTL